MNTFDAKSYWDSRHGRNYGPESVGYAGLGVPYNNWLYRVCEHVVRRHLHDQKIDVRNKDVLDIGSGTGFYVRLWEQLGARSVIGSDFSPFAVAALREKFPRIRFFDLDITAKDTPSNLGTFHVVSAFAILYHVVDDAAYERAISNIRSLVRPDGYFIFSENLTNVRDSLPHCVSRTEAEIRSLLIRNGFEPILRAPIFFMMNNPLKSSNPMLAFNWRVIQGVCYRRPRLGGLLGAALYPFELTCLRFLRTGPSTELIICHRR
jgi:SAM-dependent methyltransferase